MLMCNIVKAANGERAAILFSILYAVHTQITITHLHLAMREAEHKREISHFQLNPHIVAWLTMWPSGKLKS